MAARQNGIDSVTTFPQFINYLNLELNWPLTEEQFEALTFQYLPRELGIKQENAVGIRSIYRLRSQRPDQPWGIFFVDFEQKDLPLGALRKILSRLIQSHSPKQTVIAKGWSTNDLLFIVSYGKTGERAVSLAHFQDSDESLRPYLEVLEWDQDDTKLRLQATEAALKTHLQWPSAGATDDEWRSQWRSAFGVRYRQTVTTSKQLATVLAEAARRMKARIEAALAVETSDGPVRSLLKEVQETLVADLSDEDFADMCAQTIAYGLLSHRMLKVKIQIDNSHESLVTSPIIQDMLTRFVNAGIDGTKQSVDELGISDVESVLQQSDIAAVLMDFGNKNPLEDPVIYFYESFLEEYDKELKRKRGVYYTPVPVVRNIVKTIDECLVNELNVEDGLASTWTWTQYLERTSSKKVQEAIQRDPSLGGKHFVSVLDPACGTGTFLVEVIELIHARMMAKWKGLTDEERAKEWINYVRSHLVPRLYGFELMMAPYTIAHLKVALKLLETGYRFGDDERLNIYLTNSLEPWNPQLQLDLISALSVEARLVASVKHRNGFSVVVGNPPYSRLSSNRESWATKYVDVFKRWVPEERNLQPFSDDYLKFIAFSMSLIKNRIGTVGMITNRSFVDAPLFRAVRAEFHDFFSSLRVIDLHGDSNVGEKAPQGVQDKNIFDIKQGVAIFTGVLSDGLAKSSGFAEAWGSKSEKLAQLTNGFQYHNVVLDPPFWQFTDDDNEQDESWPDMSSLYSLYSTAVRSDRDDFALSFTQDEAREKVKLFLGEKSLSDKARILRFTDTKYWSAEHAISEMRKLKKASIRKINYRPFDIRYIVYEDAIVGAPRRSLTDNITDETISILVSKHSTNNPWDSAFAVRGLAEYKCGDSSKSTHVFPLLVGAPGDSSQLVYSEKLGSGAVSQSIEIVSGYIYATLYSNRYRLMYQDQLSRGYPAIPPTDDSKYFLGLGELGYQLLRLHASWEDAIVDTSEGLLERRWGEVKWAENSLFIENAGARINLVSQVSESVWAYKIGGYKVLKKWLDFRSERSVDGVSLAHIRAIVKILTSTIELQNDIDEYISLPS